MEIERKFIINKLPSLENYQCDSIIQGYVSITPEIRVRKKGNKYYLTEKGEGLMAREENEAQISQDEFEMLFSITEGRTIEKTRYYIDIGKYTAELDVYSGKHEGLITVEVEFPSVDEAMLFEAPTWFGRELTNDERYRNKNLALSGKTPLST